MTLILPALPTEGLETSQTRIRPWHIQDAPALVAAWSDPLIRQWLEVPDLADAETAERWITGRERAWRMGISVDLVIADRGSDAVVGEAGLSNFDAARKAALIGWWVGPDWRRRGIATEAVTAVVGWALQSGVLGWVVAEIQSANAASIAVAKRAGMRQINAAPHGDRIVFAAADMVPARP